MTDTVNALDGAVERIKAHCERLDTDASHAVTHGTPSFVGTRYYNYDLARDLRTLLAAAPKAEPVDHEWFGVAGAVNQAEALAVALFAARCPGIRMTDEDMHYYLSAAESALSAVSAELDYPIAPKAEPVSDLPPISFDGPHKPNDHRVWLARQLLDSKNDDATAYGIAAFHPAISDLWKKSKTFKSIKPKSPKVEQEPVGYAYGVPNDTYVLLPNATLGLLTGIPLYRHPAPASDELLEALKPFADAAVDLDDGETGHIWERPAAMSIDASDLRRAYELYVKHKGPQ